MLSHFSILSKPNSNLFLKVKLKYRVVKYVRSPAPPSGDRQEQICADIL